MEKWSDVKKEIKSISDEEKKAIEILAALEIPYDDEDIRKIVEVLNA